MSHRSVLPFEVAQYVGHAVYITSRPLFRESRMNFKRLFYAASTIFLFALLWNGVVHMVILRNANLALEHIARPASERSLLLSLVQTAAISFCFVLTYALSGHPKGLMGGLAHGALFGLLAGLFVDLNQYILYPIPAGLVMAWFGFGFAEFCIYGLLATWLYPIGAQPSGQADLAHNAAQGRLP